MYALIFNNKVQQVSAEPFDVHPNMRWIDVTGVDPQPGQGWWCDDQDCCTPPPPVIMYVDPKIALREQLEAVKSSLQDAMAIFLLNQSQANKTAMQDLQAQKADLEAQLAK